MPAADHQAARLPLRRPGSEDPPLAPSVRFTSASKPTLAKPSRLKLTQRLAEQTAPPADGYKTIWDSNLPGFGLRISSMGRRSWIAMYRVAGGKQVMETLGTLAAIPSIADARALARASFEQARQGVNPVEARKRPADEAEPPCTLSKLIEEFIKKHHGRRGSRPSTVYEARRLFNRALAYLGDKPVHEITKKDILALVNDLADTRINKWRGNTKGGSLSEAAGVLRHLRTCFRWAVAENLVEVDPTAGVRNPLGGQRERERVLSADEVKALWGICEEIGYPYGPLVQLLLLTGQRLREVGEMPWHELGDLEKRVWSLPSARAKNKHAHDIHLSDLAMEIIGRLPRFSGYVFSFNGKQPVHAYSRPKTAIDRRLEEKLGTVEPWVLHDLRRTCATGMAKLRIPPHVVEKCINHVKGTISGIAGIYNRFDYFDEKQEALDIWGRFVEELVYPERAKSNVVDLRPVAAT